MHTLIIGGDGMIGRALKRHLVAAGHDVIATTRNRDRVSDTTIFLDMAQPHSGFPPVDVAVICAGIPGFSDCRNFPELARRVNVTGPEEIARQLIERGTRVVRLSSSAVFDCLSPKVRAEHPTASRSAYGQFQAEAERAILVLGPQASVLRLTKIITPQFELFRNWMSALVRGQAIEAFIDHGICPISLETGVDAITAVVDQPEGGIFQVSGSGDISYADLALWLVGRLGMPRDRVVPVRAVEKGLLTGEVTPHTSMDTARLTALTGFIPMEPIAVFDEIFGADIKALRHQFSGEKCKTILRAAKDS